MAAPDLSTLLRKLHSSGSLLEAAQGFLDALMKVVEDAAATGRYRRGRVLQAVLHLRPEGGYRGLVVLESGQDAATVPEDPAFLSSATAWRTVSTERRPLAVDVQQAEYRFLGDAEAAPQAKPVAQFEGQQTLNLMQRRNTTHMLVLPLVDVGAELLGMVSVEVHCPQAVGRDYVWPACVEQLQTLAELATPYLSRLPWAVDANVEQAHPLLPVVGPTMQVIVRHLRVFARQRETVLLLGATGTGKSRLARWSHAVSRRASGPFEVLELNTIPSELQMGELFGWRKGAFTGAIKDRDGAVSRAAGGTLFIDEIDKLSLRAQASLLHLLEEGRFRPLGSEGDYQDADVRFVVGTNADLNQAIRDGAFLEDLYYRINVLPVRLPPLNQRRDEIGAWADFMVARCAGESEDVRSASLDAESRALLEGYDWPGNLRQLDNILRRAFSFALADAFDNPAAAQSLTIEAAHVAWALRTEHRFSQPKQLPEGLLPAMIRASELFVAEAQRLAKAGGSLELDHSLAFRGLVLDSAIEATGDVGEAFTLLGKGSLVESRNHQRALKAAHAQVEDLKLALDGPAAGT